jgi:ectoine hydroxylase-related dioxygenase (phytanoyl-CoA dioxygenase family)
MRDLTQFVHEIQTTGYAIVRGILPPDYIARARQQLMAAIEAETKLPYNNKNDFAMVLLCSLYGGAMLELFEIKALTDHFDAVLGEGCIVYAYTSSSMPPGLTNYSRRIHVDCPRIIPGYITNMGATIALDDFTEENGATYILPGSQERATPPDDEEFYVHAKRFIAPAGSVLFFNARLWHAGGQNKTEHWRHALTINMARPWMKQRLDIPRAMAHTDLTGQPECVLQKLGFLAQVPADYAEYYAPPEKRKYRQRTE